MKEKIFSLFKAAQQNIRSSFDLLIYIHKTLKNRKKETSADPLEKQPPYLGDLQAEAPSETADVSLGDTPQLQVPSPADMTSPRKRGRPKKKISEEVTSQEAGILENSPQEEKVGGQEGESSAQGKEERLKKLMKPFLIGVGGFVLILIFFFAYRALFSDPPKPSSPVAMSKTSPQAAPLKKKAPHKGTITKKPKKLVKNSLQPKLNLKTAKGVIRTINPQLLSEQALKVSPSGVQAKGRVVIILYDLGVKEEETDKILQKIPEEVTLAVSPYTQDAPSLIQDLSLLGHTVLLEMPWENDDPYVDTGRLTLSTQEDQGMLKENLKTLLKLSKGTAGFFVTGGERLMRYPESLTTVLKYMVKHQKKIIAPSDVLMSQLHVVANQVKVSYVCTTMVDPREEDFQALDALIKRSGFVILAFPLKKNVDSVIKSWIKKVERAKLVLVPASKIFHLME